ncbi:hypothetical protein JCM10213v2_005713 [Rhodosporidiobolus nylandii]
MSLSTPTLPLELPPFQLSQLLAPVFPPAPSSPTSPSRLPPSSPTRDAPASRFSALVGAAAAAAGSVTGAGTSLDGAKQLTVRSVEAGDQRVWVGASNGAVRTYEVSEDAGPAQLPLGLMSPGSPGRRTPVKQHTSLDLVEEAIVTPSKKAADRIALLPRLDKVAILSEGVLSFHSLPSLAPLNLQQFPSIRGVATFAIDEDELAGGGEPNAMNLVAFKRRTIHWLRITNEGIASVKDLPLRGGALEAVFRHSRVCIADAENYSIVDLSAAEALPLLPISQVPHPDPLRGAATSAGTATPPPSAGGPDPRHRPAIACVGDNEFLIASHTGTTTLGVFMNEYGEPSRGTLEWASNLRSLVVDSQYSIALLVNNTIEVHSIHSQEIVQVVQPPFSSSPSSGISSFQPRSLVKSWLGLELGAATGANKVEPVSVPLLALSASSAEPPSTPTRRRSRSNRLSISSASIRSGLTSTSSPFGDCDALIEKGREADAKSLADEFEKSLGPAERQNSELAYVYLRLAFSSLAQTSFQDAFTLFLKSGCDPRLAVRMFPDLRDPLISAQDEVEVVKGVEASVREGKGVDEYILDNLNRNYSPHLHPSVADAPSTVELRSSLAMTARDSLLSYLMKWRAARRSGDDQVGVLGEKGDSRKVDMVVDTTLVRLLAEQSRPGDITQLLTSPEGHDVVLPLVESALLSSRLYSLLTSIYLERGEVEKTLEVFAGVVDGKYDPPAEEDGLSGKEGVKRVFDLVWKEREQGRTEKWGLWVLKHDQDLGLKLFIDPKQTLAFDTRDLFAKMSAVDPMAADMFLESTVLQERDSDGRLHAELVKRYIGRLGELLADPVAKAHLREQESEYATLTASTSSLPTFLSFLTSRYSASSPHALLNRVRLKALLFLGASSKYDVEGAKQDLDEMEMEGMRGLTLERAVVYGKLHLDRQAFSLLLNTLHDLASAETYSLQSGDPLCTADVPLSQAKREGEARRKQSLARLLVEMCLARSSTVGNAEQERDEVVSKEQAARLLETQALHLDALEILPLLPSSWPLHLLTPYLTRSLRQSLHGQQDASILKNLASAQNLAVSKRLYQLQLEAGPTVETSDDGDLAVGAGGEKKGEKIVVVAAEKLEGRATEREKVVSAIASDDAVELDLR